MSASARKFNRNRGKQSGAITSAIYFLRGGKTKATSWSDGGEEQTGNHERTEEHAERKAFAKCYDNDSTGAKTFCLVTDDFPCLVCISFFLHKSVKNQLHFILRCTANSAYAADSGFADSTNKFKKDLTGDLYVTNGQIYAAGRDITVSNVPEGWSDNKHALQTAKITGAASQSTSFTPPAVFSDIPALPG
jgi:hypothetical protein